MVRNLTIKVPEIKAGIGWDVVGCRGVGKYGVISGSLLFYVVYGCVVMMY